RVGAGLHRCRPALLALESVMMRAAVAALVCLYALSSVRAQNLSAAELNNRLIHRRAVEAIMWGMPAVNLDLMLQATIGSAKGKPTRSSIGRASRPGRPSRCRPIPT